MWLDTHKRDLAWPNFVQPLPQTLDIERVEVLEWNKKI